VTTSAATIRWSAPAATGGAALLGYRVTLSPGTAVLNLGPTATTATFAKLAAGHRYTATVAARNLLGVGTAATAVAQLPVPVPPAPPIAKQTTPAPVSTSHYLRHLTGNLAADAAAMRGLGALDARYNPSGHRYLVLLDIGGQTGGGVYLSATSRFLSYPALVSAVNAYADGYASTQKANAPMLLALGTNNDVDVSRASGSAWATQVVNPAAAHVARHPNMTVAGANDIEPGFSSTVAEARAWVTGFLASTAQRYVFNGSADGCSTSGPGGRCNNGWSQADLQWVGGGAAPTRSLALPQIYNSAMALQWRNISWTGVTSRLAALRFAGPLTEWTACSQAGCSSISNIPAWQLLWQALSSVAVTRQSELSYGTDLRID
jgi:hypothetical protein